LVAFGNDGKPSFDRICRRILQRDRSVPVALVGFDDAPALWQAVREHRLEGVVAKKIDEPYRPGERTWIKRKNPDWPRYEAEREAAIRERQRRLRPALSRTDYRGGRSRFQASPLSPLRGFRPRLSAFHSRNDIREV